MAQTILTSTEVTREALRVLHQKLSFVGSINRTYDDSFAKSGGKIGDSLKIRLPNEYSVRTGRTIDVQDTAETSVTLQVATQKGVDLQFTSAELTLSIDDFSKRFLDPAMSVLASHIEADALNMYKDVYQVVDQDTESFDFDTVLAGREKLNDALAPPGERTALLSSRSTRKIVDNLKGLFQDSSAIAKQYREGMMGRTGGFDFYENTLLPMHTTGTAAKTTGYTTTTTATQSGATLTVTGGTTTFLVGDVFTIAGVNRVHPESKTDTGELQSFVVTANSGASATSLAISPSIVTTGAKQNVVITAGSGKALVKLAAGASEVMRTDMVYHKDAFTFTTADLILPKGVHFAAREVFDGISMRILQAYDINNDNMPCRIDVLYGYKTIRPQLAARLHADG